MKALKTIADQATKDINALLQSPLSKEQAEQISNVIERAVVRALLEGQHRAVDAALQCPEADQDMAHKIANAIRRKNDVLIANLSALR